MKILSTVDPTPHSELFPKDDIYDAGSRIRKANRIVRILAHAMPRPLRELRCLDLGCGQGYMTEVFASHFLQVCGVDTDPAAVLRAQQREQFRPKIQYVLAPAEHLPFDDASFDIVVCNQVYEHVMDPPRMMTEIHRLLREGGACYFSGRNRWGVLDGHYWIPTLSWWPHAWVDRIFLLCGAAHGYPVRLLSYRSLRRLLQRFDMQDYTIPLLKESQTWGTELEVTGARWIRKLPEIFFRWAYPWLPGYIWVLKPKRKQ